MEKYMTEEQSEKVKAEYQISDDEHLMPDEEPTDLPENGLDWRSGGNNAEVVDADGEPLQALAQEAAPRPFGRQDEPGGAGDPGYSGLQATGNPGRYRGHQG